MMVWSVCFTIDRVVYPDISPKAPPTSQQMGQFPPNTVIHLKIKQNKNPVLSSSSTGEDLLSTNQRQSSPKWANIPRARQQEPTKFVEKSRARLAKQKFVQSRTGLKVASFASSFGSHLI